MKKIFAIVIALAMCMSLIAGCGSSKQETKVVSETTAQAADTAAASAEAAATEAAPAEAAATETPAATEAPEEEVTAESLLHGFYETAEDLDAAAYHMLIDMDMVMMMFGTENATRSAMDFDVTSKGNNVHMIGTMVSETSEGKESSEVESYVMEEDGSYVTYSYDKDNNTWTKTPTEQAVISRQMIPTLDASLFKLETVNENGKEQYKVSADIELNELINNSGEGMGTLLSGLSNMGIEELTGSAAVAYYFNKETKALEAVKIDMAEAFKEMFSTMIASLIEMFGDSLEGEEGSEGSEANGSASAEETPAVDYSALFSIELNKFAIELTDIQLEGIEDIVLPEAAKDAIVTESTGLFDDTEAAADEEEQELSVELASSFEFKDDYYKFTYDGKDFEINKTTFGEIQDKTGVDPGDDYKGVKVAAGETTSVDIYPDDDSFDSVSFLLLNTSEEEKELKDCVVYGYSNSITGSKDKVAGLSLGSTIEEIIAVLGNPTYGYESEYYKSYDWSSSNSQSLSFTFGEEAGAVGMSVYSYELVW